MAKKKSTAELQAELDLFKRERTAQSLSAILINLIRWGGLVLIARYGYLTIDSLAGQATAADIGIKLFSNIRISTALAWLLAGSGVFYGTMQRKLKGDTVERLQARIQELEKQRDPNRTSSDLTTRGETHPKDQ